MTIAIIEEYFFSLLYSAGEMNLNNSKTIYGDANNTAKTHETVICAINWAESSVLISGMLYSSKWKFHPNV